MSDPKQFTEHNIDLEGNAKALAEFLELSRRAADPNLGKDLGPQMYEFGVNTTELMVNELRDWLAVHPDRTALTLGGEDGRWRVELHAHDQVLSIGVADKFADAVSLALKGKEDTRA